MNQPKQIIIDMSYNKNNSSIENEETKLENQIFDPKFVDKDQKAPPILPNKQENDFQIFQKQENLPNYEESSIQYDQMSYISNTDPSCNSYDQNILSQFSSENEQRQAFQLIEDLFDHKYKCAELEGHKINETIQLAISAIEDLKVINFYKHECKIDPSKALYLGEVFQLLQEHQKAIPCFQKVLQGKKNFKRAYKALISSLISTKKINDILHIFFEQKYLEQLQEDERSSLVNLVFFKQRQLFEQNMEKAIQFDKLGQFDLRNHYKSEALKIGKEYQDSDYVSNILNQNLFLNTELQMSIFEDQNKELTIDLDASSQFLTNFQKMFNFFGNIGEIDKKDTNELLKNYSSCVGSFLSKLSLAYNSSRFDSQH